LTFIILQTVSANNTLLRKKKRAAQHMFEPGRRSAVPGICAAKLRTRARRQRSQRETSILSLASTALGQSSCRRFGTLQPLEPWRPDIRQIINTCTPCTITHHYTAPVWLFYMEIKNKKMK